MRKRPKIKLKRRPATWLPEVAELLGLNIDEILDYVPHLGPAQDLDDVFRLRCNNLTHQVLRAVKELRRRPLQELYLKVCSQFSERHETYMIQRLVYTIADALDLITPRMKQNYERVLELGPDGVIDLYGGSWRSQLQPKTGKKKGGSTRSKKEKAERGPTVTGTIEALLQRQVDGGTSKSEIIAELKRRFPGRAERAMINTVGVQLSYHLKKKWGDKFRKLDKDHWTILS